jgi:hypothetical protein
MIIVPGLGISIEVDESYNNSNEIRYYTNTGNHERGGGVSLASCLVVSCLNLPLNLALTLTLTLTLTRGVVSCLA